ncbi:hypothetical protein ACFQY5_35900 [Paeniroseomonas aquatica]|uniref:hypothetical protein n=1 Tax=Paeniroseomonas aquatica TaxID=373043 RepID=UPI003612E90D
MSGFWKGYANVNDDVRHTYEQVFFGRQTTGNLTEAEVPGMKPEQPAPDAFAGEGSSTNAPRNTIMPPSTAACGAMATRHPSAPASRQTAPT